MKAVGYVRVSTKEQVKGVSLDVQKEKISHFCRAKDWNLDKYYTDEGISGAKVENRAGIQELMEICRDGQTDVVVVYKLDRLTRSVKDLGILIEFFEEQEIAFSSVLSSFDTTTASGRLVMNILGSVAQWEREIIAERTKDALQHKKEKRRRYGALPYGFDLGEDEELVENERELKVIGKMKRWRQKGLPLGKIAEKLNEAKIPTKKEGNWYAGTVKYMLENELYAFI